MSDESTKKDGEGTPAAEEAKEEATSKSAEGAEAKSEAKAEEAAAEAAEAKAEEKHEAAEAKDAKAEEPPGAKVSISEKPPAKADDHHETAKAAHDHDHDHGDHDHDHDHGDHGHGDHGHGDGHIAYDDQGPLVAEPDRPRAGIITAITIGIMVTVAVSCALIWSYYVTRFHAEVEAKQGNIEDPALRDLRALETARLTKYQWVKQEAGIVRIPVTRAKELVLKDYEKAGPYVPKPPVSLEPPKEPAKVEEPSPAPAQSASASTAASAAASGSAAPAGSTSAAPSASAPKHQH